MVDEEKKKTKEKERRKETAFLPGPVVWSGAKLLEPCMAVDLSGEALQKLLHETSGYGWNQAIAAAIEKGNYCVAAALCAQARVECLDREKKAPDLVEKKLHFRNYLRLALLEDRIERQKRAQRLQQYISEASAYPDHRQ